MTEPVLDIAETDRTLGLATLVRTASDAEALGPLVEALVARLATDPDDAAARLDLSTLLQLTGHRERGLEMQGEALARRGVYRRIFGTGEGLHVLNFVAPGDLMTNTPLDFLLEGSNARLTSVYVAGALPPPDAMPEHDVAFLGVSQSEENDPILAGLRGAFQAWPRSVINGYPERISALTRDGVSATLAGHPLVVSPETLRLPRAVLLAALEDHDPAPWVGPAFPVIIRPVGSHAGKGLEKLETLAELAPYLAQFGDAEFYVAAFHDYSSPDGLFRKLRIAFVDGRPLLSHMAVSPRWMVHYMNADMEENAGNRAEEAALMANFDETFAARHADAFEALTRIFGLDYYGIDCGETQDGKLLLFEADVAMIVHAMDPPDLFPYKAPAMARLFAVFEEALKAKAEGVTPPPAIAQRSQDDCMVCALAMLANRTYDEVIAAARREQPGFQAGQMMPHALMRRLAHGWGLALVSSIYMDWRFPGIVGVISRTLEGCGHALYWDGQRLIDPSGSGLYDEAYVAANGVEFTQRAGDLAALITLERSFEPAAARADAPDVF